MRQPLSRSAEQRQMITDEELSLADAALLIGHLGRALAVFDRAEGRLGPAEISAKSILTVLRNDLRQRQRRRMAAARDLTLAPWSLRGGPHRP